MDNKGCTSNALTPKCKSYSCSANDVTCSGNECTDNTDGKESCELTAGAHNVGKCVACVSNT